MAARITAEKRSQIVELLVEGNSCRSTSRIAEVHLETVLHQLVEVGGTCRKLMDHRMRNLSLEHLQIDEIFTFCGKRQVNLKDAEKNNPQLGEQYLFYALDENTKLIPCHCLGKRTKETTYKFLMDLSRRIVTPTLNAEGFKPQVSTDAFAAYAGAMDTVFANTVRYGQITKVYSNPEVGRYSPPNLARTERHGIQGIDDILTICTSHIERANLTLRTFARRFTRLALGFSRKWDNLRLAIDLQFCYYNFCWVHGTLKTTPAVAAGLCEKPWTVDELLTVCDLF